MAVAEREDDLAAFLLGALPEAEHDALEERLLADGGLQDRLDLAVDDLIHAYLAGGLPPPEREAFEKHFLLSARHRERLDFLRDLVTATARVAARTATPRHSPRPWASRTVWWPVAAALLIGVAVVAAVWARRQDGRPGQTAIGPSPSASPSVSVPVPAPPRRPPAAGERKAVAEVRVRQGPRAVTDLPIGVDTGTVRLLVAVEPAPSYDVVVSDAAGREAWRAQGLTLQARGEPLAVSVPAEVFAENDYVLAVQGEAFRSASPAVVVRRLRVVRGER